MTDIIQYEGIENLGTTTDLINGKPIYDLDRVIETSGFTTAGDGGAGKWKQNGITGQTPSQTPAQLGDALLNDASGNQWALCGESINCLQFGADSSGLIDSRSAIQANIDAGVKVNIPSGEFLIGEPGLRVGDNVFIEGAGKKITKLKKIPGITNLDPIIREKDGFLPVNNFNMQRLSLVGNADAAQPSLKGAGLLRFYEAYGVTIIGCDFTRSRGYGLGLQGSKASTTTGKQGPQEKILIDNCDFYDNGKFEYLLGSDTDDGLDCKNLVDGLITNCRAWDNGDKGFDIRAERVTLSNCFSSNNAGAGFSAQIEGYDSASTEQPPATISFISCHSYDNEGNGFSVVPQSKQNIIDPLQIVTFVACEAKNNAHNFVVTSEGSNKLALCHVELTSCQSYNPKSGFRHYLASGKTESLTVNGGNFIGGNTTAVSVNSNDEGCSIISGASFDNIGGSAITGSINSSAKMTITGCSFKNINGAVFSGGSNNTIVGNIYENISQSGLFVLSGTNNKVLDKDVGLRSVSSSALLPIDERTDFFAITGTTDITSLPDSYAGRVVHLRFLGILTINDGGNIKLNDDFTTSSNDMLNLICDGPNWFEVSRSTN